ncbi:MAG TPA: Sec-independent protein translocase protein TatB [Gammaproteobacteria bacterium]|nr:Sec-independent protein translocase protein TatB [Gammaproteobacteria bacterium]
MFDVGFGELVLLFVIGLLVLGPQRLPKVAAELGKWVGRARRTASELRRQLEREIELSEITQPPPSPPPPATAPPQAEPTSIPPDPYTPEAQHGHEAHSSANGGASDSAAAEPPTPAPAEPAPAETPSQPQDPVHSPPQH